MVTVRATTSVTGLETRLLLLEASESIRWIISRYMELCDVPQPEFDLAELGALFTEDATWQGIGPEYDEKFGRYNGRAAIAQMLGSHLLPGGPFTANAHVLGEGRINISLPTASGSWIMQQVSQYTDGRQEVVAARITVDFELDGALALIKTFRTQRLVALSPANLATPH
ncbi:nuclear transport factor 2 family protein [Paeniglutamicibacter sp. MACA_103]|uniref:nuclear transport factor 2 family protein n=1 Tax=Paeniglutamicibacter sp. MACA_103 TaxID=3377337 RepID=UPI0038956EA5